jgi:hypothetical protein
MWQILRELSWQNLRASARGLGVASYVLIAVLFGLLVAAVVLADLGWRSAVGTDVPPVGYVAMALGVVFSVVVGAGLMALVFYSSRSGYDEPAKLIDPDDDDQPK